MPSYFSIIKKLKYSFILIFMSFNIILQIQSWRLLVYNLTVLPPLKIISFFLPNNLKTIIYYTYILCWALGRIKSHLITLRVQRKSNFSAIFDCTLWGKLGTGLVLGNINIQRKYKEVSFVFNFPFMPRATCTELQTP